MMSMFNKKKPDRSRYPVVSDEYWDFIEHCWSDAPKDRPSAGSIEVTMDEFKYNTTFHKSDAKDL
jgi:hypothetical protein